MVDADYRFQYVEVGAEGRCSDATLFNESQMITMMENGRLLYFFIIEKQ